MRSVNNIVKFVREAMPIQEEDKASENSGAKVRPLLKPSLTSGWDLLLLNRDNGLTLKHRNPMILVVFKCQNSSLDYFDTVKKFIEKLMEQYIMTMLLTNARKGDPTIQDIGQMR